MRALRFFAVAVGAYGLLVAPGLVWPSYLDSPVGVVVAVPYLSIYVFHSLGVPKLLEHDGACGWGWCAPTTFGWVFLVAVWLGVAWLGASLVARLTRGRPPRPAPGP